MEDKQVKIIAFYATNENVGKSTVSIAMASELANLGKKVLYVEADQVRPSFSIVTGLHHDSKNMLELVKKENDYNILHYICTKQDLAVQKVSPKVLQKLHDNLSFLTFPAGYHQQDFPKIKSKEMFVKTFMESLMNAPYDYVILSVPNELSEILSYPILHQADVVINILNSNPRGALALQKELRMLEEAKLTVPHMFHVLNMGDENFAGDIENLSLQNISITIPYDQDRSSYEWAMQIGSPLINERVHSIMDVAGLNISKAQLGAQTGQTRRGLFGFR
ncbi:chromosome partitioning protein ParA [Bacillus sp. AFS098217]|uniref:tyrosine-protein kinase family protein n=1 Tax=Bacillus sp. AFS098217 TaxID=2033868 RepID=UPI000BED2010|nr:AAA family ATPase [Bacillus sp. AFS098217]PEB54628.1 chromosome partitioning protein ParA [Bacillus sp. AFS098217]